MRAMGFMRVERYNENPVADVVFFRRGLSVKGVESRREGDLRGYSMGMWFAQTRFVAE